ncbi:MAG TPA: recombinase family protein [Ignavibacteriaceae bacterium]|nr:recombinase family protein [Ignavibacteriaceae bacterium]
MINTKYFIYARKSSESEDRQVESISSQVDVLKKLSEERKLEIVDVLTEAKSAKSPGRPVFNKMIERISKEEADGIICWKTDRLFRNPVDFGTISWMLQNSIIKHIQCSDRSYYPEDNVLLMSVEQGMANQFIRDLSKNTKRGLKAKAERGWYPAQPPLGYLHNPLKRKGEKEMMKDPARFEMTRKIFDWMLSGTYLPSQVIDKATKELGLTNRFNRSVGRATIYQILRNPFYYGYYEYPKNSGNWIKGNHEPMISKTEFDRIQKLLAKNENPKPETKVFSFTGLIRCGECGAMITAEDKVKNQKNGNTHNYTYYRCTKRTKHHCSQKTVEVKILEQQIMEYLRAISIPEEFIRFALDAINADAENDSNRNKEFIETYSKEIVILNNKCDKLMELKLNDLISEEDFIIKQSEFKKRIQELKLIIEERTNTNDNVIVNVEDLLKFGKIASEVFPNATVEEKRIILSSLGSNLLIKDRKLQIQFEKPLSLLNEISSSVKGKRVKKGRLEPAQVVIKKGTYSDKDTINPLVLREQDSNLQPFG